MKKKLLLLVFALVLAMSMSVPVLATSTAKTFEKQGIPSSTIKKIKKKQPSTFDPKSYETSRYVVIFKPVHNSVFYKGEKIFCKTGFFSIIQGLWGGGMTPSMCIFDSNNKMRARLTGSEIVPVNYIEPFYGIFTTHRLSAGKYSFVVFGSTNGEYEPEDDYFEKAAVDFYIRILKAPKSVKAKAAKKKVTVSFAKATGAKKYQIYRSTKKTSGFKKVKTTTSRKYVDRKVKRGKRYYYKVKSVRTGKGTVKSEYSKVVRTKKVR